MRHGKCRRGDEGLGDHRRQLDPDGREQCLRVAGVLRARGWIPDAVVSSDALRTRQTWASMEGAFDRDIAVRFSSELYLAGLGALQASAEGWDVAWSTVLAMGHNPGWQAAASVLSGVPVGFSTATAALLEGEDVRWGRALESPWRLVELVRPGGI